jgi:dihydropyrimidinase
MKNHLLIVNAKIVLETGLFEGSILVNHGLIENIFSKNRVLPEADIIIDAQGKFVFPGAIDPHVHLNLKTPMGTSSDDFYSGSKAALRGGTTTLIDFITPARGESLLDAIRKRKAEAADCLVDYTFHLSPVEWSKNTAMEIIQAIHSEHIVSFKVYMAYKNSIGLEKNELELVLRTVGKYGGIVLVHAEMGDEIEENVRLFVSKGLTSPEYHARSRPPQTESEAVSWVVNAAMEHKCPLYVVHTSCGSSISAVQEMIKSYKKSPVYFETCPQYLLFNDEVYQSPIQNALPFVISPPIRPEKERMLLKSHLLNANIHSIGTDHCPFTRSEKIKYQHDFTKIPNGVGGIEFRLPVIYNELVVKEGMSVLKFVKLVATNPAKIFGLYPQKGVIRKGSDADLIIWDENADFVFDTKSQWQQTDINIYDGYHAKGKPVIVIRKGEIVVREDVLVKQTKGEFLDRKPIGKSGI